MKLKDKNGVVIARGDTVERADGVRGVVTGAPGDGEVDPARAYDEVSVRWPGEAWNSYVKACTVALASE